MVSCSSNLLKSSFAKPPNTLGHKRRRNSIIVVSARRASAWDPGPQNADPSVARLDEAPPTVCSAMLEILGALFVCLLGTPLEDATRVLGWWLALKTGLVREVDRYPSYPVDPAEYLNMLRASCGRACVNVEAPQIAPAGYIQAEFQELR